MSSEDLSITSQDSLYFSIRETDSSIGSGGDESTLDAEPAELSNISDCNLTKLEKTLQKPNTPLYNTAIVRMALSSAGVGTPAKSAKKKMMSPKVQKNKENQAPNKESSPDEPLNHTRVEESSGGTVLSNGNTWLEAKLNAISPTQLLLDKMGKCLDDLNLEEPPFGEGDLRPSIISVDFESIIPKAEIRTPGGKSASQTDSEVELVSSFDESFNDQMSKNEFEKKLENMSNAKVSEIAAKEAKKAAQEPLKPKSPAPKRKSLLPMPKRVTHSTEFRANPVTAAAKRAQFAKKPATAVSMPEKPLLSRRSQLVPLRALHTFDKDPSKPMPKTTLNNRRSLHPASLKPTTFKINSTTLPQRRMSGIGGDQSSAPRLSIGARKSIIPASRKSIIPASRKSILPPRKPPVITPPSRRTIVPSATPSTSSSTTDQLQCEYCDKKFAKVLALHNHLRQSCHKVPTHVKKRLLSQDLTLRELEVKRKPSDQVDSLMPPPSASAVRPSSASKREHGGISRTPKKKISCFECKISFLDAATYAAHMADYHQG